jgi:hypothetical protein
MRQCQRDDRRNKKWNKKRRLLEAHQDTIMTLVPSLKSCD